MFYRSTEGKMRILRQNNLFTESDSESGAHQLGNPNCKQAVKYYPNLSFHVPLKFYYLEKEKKKMKRICPSATLTVFQKDTEFERN